MKKVLFLLVLLNMGTGNGFADNARQPDSAYRHCQQLSTQGLYRQALAAINQALAGLQPQAPQDSNLNLIAELYYLQGFNYFHLDEAEQSLQSFYSILQLPEAKVSPLVLVKAHIGISNIFNQKNEGDKATNHLHQAYRLNENGLHDDQAYLTIYNNLSNAYFGMEKYDSSLFFLNKANNLTFASKDSSSLASIQLNIANTYQRMKRYQIAENYYFKAIALSQNDKRRPEYATALTGLTSLWQKMGKHRESIDLLSSCIHDSNYLILPPVYKIIYNRMSESYRHLGRFDSALYYADLRNAMSDSIYNQSRTSKYIQLQTAYDLQKIQTSNKLLEESLTRSQRQSRQKSIGLLLVAGFFLCMLTLFVYTRKKLKRKTEEMEKLQEELFIIHEKIDREKADLADRFQTQIETKDKELTTNALLLIKAEGIANDILDKIKEIKTETRKNEKVASSLSDIEYSVKELSSGKIWDDFRYYFEKVNVSFFDRLKEKYPELSPSDHRFAALLSLNLSTKEIAILTNRTIRGVETSRFRLRKKMHLNPDDNLIQKLQDLKS